MGMDTSVEVRGEPWMVGGMENGETYLCRMISDIGYVQCVGLTSTDEKMVDGVACSEVPSKPRQNMLI